MEPRGSIHGIHDISKIGETKQDRDYYIKFYKCCSAMYSLFLLFALAVIIILDTLPEYVRECIEIQEH